jgi:hypothetical protein
MKQLVGLLMECFGAMSMQLQVVAATTLLKMMIFHCIEVTVVRNDSFGTVLVVA